MKKKLLLPTLGVCAVCAIGGAAVSGVASSSAATKSSTNTAAQTQAGFPGPGGPGGPGGGRGHGGPGGPGGGGIHSESVVPDDDGSGFVTITSDRGTLTAIDGSTLTIKEGTADETYDTVKVVADGTVTVMRNGKTAKVSSLKVGDHVSISKDGTDTRIFAATAAWEKTMQAQHDQREQQREEAAT